MWAILGPLLAPILDAVAKLAGLFVAYKAGESAKRAESAETAMGYAKDVRQVAEDRGVLPLDARRGKLRERFARRP